MSTPSKTEKLNVTNALKILQHDGLLSRNLKGFEPRAAQQQMMLNVIEAYNKGGIALIEAGTGTGKSMAYLIPAMLWAYEQKERTVISTNTITLQEQLIDKDIPLLAKALNLDLKAVLVKGMSNYVCLRKLEEVNQELPLLSPDEIQEIEQINVCLKNPRDGSRSDLSFVPSSGVWERVCAENDTCNKQECPHFQECHFFKARRKANDAQLLVVNHHMLFADLACRSNADNYKDAAILPLYNHVILDEAHHIEDIATEYFAAHVSQMSIHRVLVRLASEKQGKLPALKAKLQSHYRKNPSKEFSSLYDRLTNDLPGLRRDLNELINETFETYGSFAGSFKSNKPWDEASPGESKLRLLPTHHTVPGWTEGIIPRTQRLIGALQRYIQAVSSLEIDLKALKNDRFDEQTKTLRMEITAMTARLVTLCEVLKSFIDQPSPQSVRWIDRQQQRRVPNIQLVNAELDVAKRLVEFLFSKFPTTILCSATMTTNKQFQYIRQRLGIVPELLPTKRVTEHIYDSPFDYERQTLFAIPTDIPNPLDPNFNNIAAQKIWQCVEASRGNAFVLFTSYSMLKACHQQLAQQLEKGGYTVLKQGDDNRQSLLNRFKTTDRSVLFGTDSFWEGVDVVGDALRCVIIVKLPFKVPSEPIIQARTEAISAKGGNPFLEYSLPDAIVKFKQGFGRLIRNKRDRGCIVCLDSRLLNKSYGQLFLNSLPSCQQVFKDSNTVYQSMSEFYRKTYYLVSDSKKK